MTRPLPVGQPPGQKHPAAKLTEAQAREILARLAAGESQKALASEFGVTPSCLSHLRRKASWAHLGGGPPVPHRGSQVGSSKLTEADIPNIILMIERGETIAAVARAYGVGRTAIANIWHGRRWKHVPRPQKRRRAVYEDLD